MSKFWIGYQVWLHTMLIGIALLNIHPAYPALHMQKVSAQVQKDPVQVAALTPDDHRYNTDQLNWLLDEVESEMNKKHGGK